MVGYDAAPGSQTALSRACDLGGRVVVLTRTGTPRPEALAPDMVVRKVGRVAPDVVFDVAAELGAQNMVVSDAMANPVVALRPAMLAARRSLRSHGGAHACLLVVRPGSNAPPYRHILVGVDASPGAAVAAVVAGRTALANRALLDVAAIERRRDSALRELVDRLTRTDDERAASVLRTRGPVTAPHLQHALEALSCAGVETRVDFRVGDPADVLVRRSRVGDHDLLVSSTIGVNGHGRQGHVAQVTRRLLRLSHVDHMVVFDAFSLGLRTAETAGDVVIEASANELVGEASTAVQEAAATLHDDQQPPP